MPSSTELIKIVGRTAGSDLGNKLIVLNNVSIANAFRNIANWFDAVAIGRRSYNGWVFAGVGGVPAAQTVTFVSFVAGDTVTINGVVYTGSDTATTAQQIKTGGTDTATAKAFAAVINGIGGSGLVITPPAKIRGIVRATSALGVVTLTAEEPGAIGNLYTAAISAHGSVGAATFASGADGVIVPLAKGI